MPRRRRPSPLLLAPLAVAVPAALVGPAPAAAADPVMQSFECADGPEAVEVPVDVETLTVMVGGARGEPAIDSQLPEFAATGGSGEIVQVELGTTYAGETLYVLAGCIGGMSQTSNGGGTLPFAEGGSGSYVALDDAFLVVAGGGGGGGMHRVGTEAPDVTLLDGGDGGGEDGRPQPADAPPTPDGWLAHGGLGGTAATPGGGGNATPAAGEEQFAGTAGGSASVSGGVITPGLGGDPGVFGGGGGGGYTGGGGGGAGMAFLDGQETWTAAAGGGGASYVADGLEESAPRGQNGDQGFVVVIWTIAEEPDEPGEPGEPGEPDEPGDPDEPGEPEEPGDPDEPGDPADAGEIGELPATGPGAPWAAAIAALGALLAGAVLRVRRIRPASDH